MTMYLTTEQRYANRRAEVLDLLTRRCERAKRNRRKRERKRLDYLTELRNLEYIINLRNTP